VLKKAVRAGAGSFFQQTCDLTARIGEISQAEDSSHDTPEGVPLRW